MSEITKLLEIMDSLRDPDSGCPWDLEQDFATIAPYTIEEAYEVADAIDRDDMPGLRDELGDLLFLSSVRMPSGAQACARAAGNASRRRSAAETMRKAYWGASRGPCLR
jgi:phosphoribosyl-ATP pyrophosphohydrolase